MNRYELRGNVISNLRITKLMAEKAAREFKRCETFVEKLPIFYKQWIEAWYGDIAPGAYIFEVYLPNGRLVASVRVKQNNGKVVAEYRVEGYLLQLYSQWQIELKKALKKEGII